MTEGIDDLLDGDERVIFNKILDLSRRTSIAEIAAAARSSEALVDHVGSMMSEYGIAARYVGTTIEYESVKQN